MFPEKIEFDGKKNRTKNYNKVLDFIYQQTNELQEHKSKNGESFSTFSASVAGPGIEPGTSWLWIMRSNQLSYPAIPFRNCGAKVVHSFGITKQFRKFFKYFVKLVVF